jgi:hypothetical protein
VTGIVSAPEAALPGAVAGRRLLGVESEALSASHVVGDAGEVERVGANQRAIDQRRRTVEQLAAAE